MDQNTRPQYYEGEYLGSDDLEAIVRYARVAQARHGLGAHVWGIAIGLDLVERALGGDGVEMVLTPGVAWDGYERALVAPAPQRIGLDLFENFKDDTVPEGVPVEVWVRYRELPAAPPGVGFSCPDDTLYGRIVETFRVELRRVSVTDYHSVTIASRTVEAVKALSTFDASKAPLYDESVPEQLFPERSDNPPWPVFVGIVRWKKDAGQAGKLIARTDADRNLARKNRQYIGAVAETIIAPDGVLRLRDRARDPKDARTNFQPPIVAPPGADNDLVWCEGHLRVVGDARLQGGKLDYRVQNGGDDGVPMYLRRTVVNSAPTLDAFVGPPVPVTGVTNPQTRFTVSTTDASGNAKECLTVVTDGHVGVNQPAPTALVHLHSDNGLQGNLQLFSASADVEYDGGSDKLFIFKDDAAGATAFMGGNVGVGTTAPTAKLHVHSETNPFQGNLQLFSASADVEYDGGSDKLFIVKDTGGTTAFMGGNIGLGTTAPTAKLQLHSDNALQGDLRLFSGNADFEYDGGSDGLFLFKDNGGRTAFMGGNVGIGTTTPGVTLDVVGDLRLNGDAFVAAGFGIWTTSDAHEKHHIGPIHRPLERLLELRGVSFAWRRPAKYAASGARHLGFVAQDVEAVFPEWVKATPSGTKAIDVSGLNALLVESVRELALRCEKLESEVGDLRERVARSEQRPSRTPARPRASRKKPAGDDDAS